MVKNLNIFLSFLLIKLFKTTETGQYISWSQVNAKPQPKVEPVCWHSVNVVYIVVIHIDSVVFVIFLLQHICVLPYLLGRRSCLV